MLSRRMFAAAGLGGMFAGAGLGTGRAVHGQTPAAKPVAPTMLVKRLEGRDEPIIDPGLPIIDAHHHLFDKGATRYLFPEYIDDVNAGHNIVASVYMEIKAFERNYGPAPERMLGEVEFANGMGAIGASGVYGPCRVAAGIVGEADLRSGDAIADVLDQAIARAPDRLRGLRQVLNDSPSPLPYRFMTNPPPRGLMRNPAFRRGLRHLAVRGLSFDAAVFHTQLPELAGLADDFPTTSFILNHAGMALAMEGGAAERARVFGIWRSNIRSIAKRPNISCKIGGFGLPFWGFGFNERVGPIGHRVLAETWRPYIETCVEAFGADRCMMESNYPPDARSCGFVPLWNALKLAVAGATSAEKTALFSGTAARVYRLRLPVADRTS
ncbi:amidohydrolase family protein [Sphingomonas sp. 1P08PE]|uniref:amidohydrolase family protein n=1 Tax=Sphingomonas sp. 1P08PE TaxID=554122 RepID=UPI0039A1FB82